MLFHQIAKAKESQLAGARQDALERLIDEVLGRALDMVEPGAPDFGAGDRTEPPEINKALGWLDVAHPPRLGIADFGADPDLVKGGRHASWIIAEQLKAIVPLRELDDQPAFGIRFARGRPHERFDQGDEQIPPVFLPGLLTASL